MVLLAPGGIIAGMKRILVIAVVAAAALILGLPATHLIRSSEARPVAPIDLRAPASTQQQTKDATGEGGKKRQEPVSAPRTSAPVEASPAPALPPASAGGDDDGDDGDDDDGGDG
jgi:hypothetical protein